MEEATTEIKQYYIKPEKVGHYCRYPDKAISCRIPDDGKMILCSLVQGNRDCEGNPVLVVKDKTNEVTCPNNIHDRRRDGDLSINEVEERCQVVMLEAITNPIEYGPSRRVIKESFNGKMYISMGWSKTIIKEIEWLSRVWDKASRPDINILAERYQAGDDVLDEIKSGLMGLVYDTANKFYHEPKEMFTRLDGIEDKRLPKFDSDDPEDDEVDEPLYLTTEPFEFDDDDLQARADFSLREALDTYDPFYETKFSTWFVTLLKRDLQDLYKTYHGKAIRIKTKSQFYEIYPEWKDDLSVIPQTIRELVDVDDIDALRWLCLMAGVLPDILTRRCIREIMNIGKTTEREIRGRLKNYTRLYIKNLLMLDLSNRYGDLYFLMHILGLTRTRGPVGEFTLYKQGQTVGDIILDPDLLTVNGYHDPTAVTLAKILDGTAESPEPLTFIPAPAYNWFKDKDGLKVLPGPTGKYIPGTYIKDEDSEPLTIRFYDYVYNHSLKVYCEMSLTQSLLRMRIDDLARLTIRQTKKRKREQAYIDWCIKYDNKCKKQPFFRIIQ